MQITNIPINETLRYMGHKGDVPEVLNKVLKTCGKLLTEQISPRYVYRVVDVNITENEVDFSDFNKKIISNDLKTHLKNCDKAIIFASTLTMTADKLIRQAQLTDMTTAITMDAMCSAVIESVSDIAEKEIFSQFKDSYFTWRFSAGYGDLDISLQADFLRFLNAEKRIGLTVTPENLMIPTKSVTAIIGISKEPVEKKRRGCASCNMRESCRFNMENMHC